MNSHPTSYRTAPRPENCLITILGASGDLAARKLIPALYDLFLHRDLPEKTAILGAARTAMNDIQFRQHVFDALDQTGGDLRRADEFVEHLFYQSVVYDDPISYAKLAGRIGELEEARGLPGNRIFNLALPPSLYQTVTAHLQGAGLTRQFSGGVGWSRLVVEKPFGRDLGSARKLNRALSRALEENQIFRIDHYLGKDTVQNIFMFRFANAVFEPVWSRNLVDYVSIMASESLGVGHRSGYYEQSGVLRDMFQNHMMQLLALVAAEPPSRFAADEVRDEKVKLFRSLRPIDPENLYDNLILGQYVSGQVDGVSALGYREEAGVDSESLVPTYGTLRVFVDNWRWQGVPFYITSGKRLATKQTRIDIQFKKVPHSMFRKQLGEAIGANRLHLGIFPDGEISLRIQSKDLGPSLSLREIDLNFNFHDQAGERQFDAYEHLLLDVMEGDHTLFWRQDGVELAWAFFDPVLQECEHCRYRSQRLHHYPAGSWGPQAALDLHPGPRPKRDNHEP